jgi:hypothetical protein
VCPTEITAFSDAYNGFKELDCEVQNCCGCQILHRGPMERCNRCYVYHNAMKIACLTACRCWASQLTRSSRTWPGSRQVCDQCFVSPVEPLTRIARAKGS